MTKIIGLTGGIGSGKTTVAHMFEDLGVPLYIADDAGKEVMQSSDVLEKLTAVFPDVFDAGVLDRKKLASVVFSDKEKLERLNEIVHPAVASNFKNWLSQHKEAQFVIKEAAILFESGSHLDCDRIITVTAPFEIKIERVISRDKVTRHDVIKRMENQWTDAQKAAKSDYVIDNVGLDETCEQVVKIFKTLKKL